MLDFYKRHAFNCWPRLLIYPVDFRKLLEKLGKKELAEVAN
jgi:hypothetical protein